MYLIRSGVGTPSCPPRVAQVAAENWVCTFILVVSRRAWLTSAGGADPASGSEDRNGWHVVLDGACM